METSPPYIVHGLPVEATDEMIAAVGTVLSPYAAKLVWKRLRDELLKMSGWQPIDTAPKDGREVLLRVELRAGIPGKMLVGHYMQGGHCVEDHPPIEQGWYFWNGCNFDRAAKPLFWMPLPEKESP